MKKIAIIGGGVEGASNYRHFSSDKNNQITILDQNQVDNNQFPNATFVTGPKYLDDLDKYDVIVRSPGTHPNKIDADQHKVTSNTKEFFTHCVAPIIGVTGTKGKGTTSTLIAKFLEADGKTVHLVGNIGVSALDELPNIAADDIVVYELSSFQLMDITQSPHIAVHLMIEPDHLDVHTDMQEYITAKSNIFAYQKPQDIAVYYEANPVVVDAVKLSAASTKIPYDRNSTNPHSVRIVQDNIVFNDVSVANVSDVALVGEHMLDNVCAAIAATYALVSDKQVYCKILQTFTGLEHRLQPVGNKNGVLYVDDSISTIPSTAIAAIKAFTQPKIIILGGSDKGSDFTELAEQIVQSNIKLVYLIGQMKDRIGQALSDAGYMHFSKLDSIEEAVAEAAKNSVPGDVVLLSPACASFDMFTGYGDRGDKFKAAVQNI